MRSCTQCGTPVSEHAKFCEQCGIKLQDTPVMQDELDLTALDERALADQENNLVQNKLEPQPATTNAELGQEIKKENNIINIHEVLESEEKVEMDSTIKREVLVDDQVFSKICPMCGEDMQINKNLLENTPVVVKCLKCGHETKIW